MSFLLMLGENPRGRRMSQYKAIFFITPEGLEARPMQWVSSYKYYKEQKKKWDLQKSQYGDYFYIFVEVEDE